MLDVFVVDSIDMRSKTAIFSSSSRNVASKAPIPSTVTTGTYNFLASTEKTASDEQGVTTPGRKNVPIRIQNQAIFLKG
jgi:hypothetical protein